jgi:multiple sugar transport system substrate-binding protein
MGTNHVSRRHFLQFFTLTSAGAVLAACAPASAPQPTTAPQEPAGGAATSAPAPAPGEAAKITVFVGFGTGTDPSQIQVHNQIAKEFNDAHQDIQVEFLTVPHEENNTKFATMLSGDMAPDISMPQGLSGIAAFYDEWLDIAPYIERDRYDTSDFAGTTAEIFVFPGRLLGLPMGIYPQVVYYNENLFDAAGLGYPSHKFGEKDWTYDKLVEIAGKLTLDEADNDATSASFDWQRTKQWGWDGLSYVGTVRDVAPKWGGSSMGVSDDYKTAQYDAQPYIDCTQWTVDTVFKWHIRRPRRSTRPVTPWAPVW